MAQPVSFEDLAAGLQSAEDAVNQGRFSDALRGLSSLLEGALRARVAFGTEFQIADLMVCERLAELALLFGLEAAADDVLAGMAAACVEAGNTLGADHANLRRAELQVAAGRPEAAYQTLAGLAARIGHLERMDLSAAGVRAWEAELPWKQQHAERTALVTRLYVVLAQLLLWMGRYAEALCLIAAGTRLADDAGSPPLARGALPVLRSLQARALLESGRLPEAEVAVGLLLAAPSTAWDKAARVGARMLAGKLDVMRGRFGSATRHLQGALDDCAAAGLRRAHAVAGLNLAHALVLLNRIEEALRLARQARELATSLGDESLAARADAVGLVATARRQSAAEAFTMSLSVTDMVLGRLGTRDGCATTQTPSAPFASSSSRESFLAFLEDRLLEVQWTIATDPRRAHDAIEDLEREVAHCDSLLVAPRMLAMRALLAAADGHLGEALRLFQSAADGFLSLGLLPEAWQSMHSRGRHLARLDRPQEAAAAAADADRLLDELCETLTPADRAIYLLNKSTVEEEYLVSQVDLLMQDRDAENAGGTVPRLRSRWRVAARLDRLLSHLDHYRAALADRQVSGEPGGGAAGPSPAKRAGVLHRCLRMPRDRAIVTFIVLPDRVVAIWNAFMRFGFAVAPVSRLDVRGCVRRWHEFVQGQAEAPAGEDEEIARMREVAARELMQELGRILRIDDILRALPTTVTRLSIVADDVLHGLPFCALRYQDRYLVERFAISMPLQSRVPCRQRAFAISRVLVAGTSGQGIRRLPNVGRECAQVRQWFVDQGLAPNGLMEAAATPQRVAQELGRSHLVHLACHGIFDPDKPDASGLLLGAADDELLSIRNLAGLSLAECAHVTLSSCWSADNFILPGRWIISLPEVLLRSGAGSVLGCLWHVADEVAMSFMVPFYAELARQPRDLALREIQLRCMRGQLGMALPTHLPFFWAGYTLSGTAGRLGPMQAPRRVSTGHSGHG